MSFYDFSDLDKDFQDAETERRGFDTVPDGSYQCIIDSVGFDTTRKSGDRIFKWKFKVISGDYENYSIRKTALLRPDLLKWFKTDLARCGWQPATLSEVQDDLERLLDLWVEVKVETKNDRQNVYLQRLIENPKNPSRGDDPPPHGDDDIPY